MTHHHLGFQLLRSIQGNANHNQNGGAAERQAVHGRRIRVDDGQERNHCKEQRSNERDLGKNFGNEVRSRLAGTDTRDRAVVLTEVIGHLNRIVLNSQIEVGEHDDEQEKQMCDEGAETCVECKSSPCEKCLPEAKGAEKDDSYIVFAKTLGEIEKKYSHRKTPLHNSF